MRDYDNEFATDDRLEKRESLEHDLRDLIEKHIDRLHSDYIIYDLDGIHLLLRHTLPVSTQETIVDNYIFARIDDNSTSGEVLDLDFEQFLEELDELDEIKIIEKEK